MILRRAAAALVCAAVCAASWTARADAPSAAAAVLQGLDKVTARVSTIEAPVGGEASFGTLVIAARTCRKRPPEETPETAAFLEIVDHRPGEPPRLVFSGWMFASSPALSAMEHPVYDVWVIDCRTAAGSGGSDSE